MSKKRPRITRDNSEMSERGGGLGSSGLKPPSKIRPPARAGDGPADTFKVGDRVKAAGKRGVIAFLGDTEFASGHWAGIVLDDPVGKTNIQYFLHIKRDFVLYGNTLHITYVT